MSPEGFTLSQTPAIVMYLGQRFGFYPDTLEGQARATQITNSAMDLHNAGRACYHPVNNMASYYTQVEEAKVAVAEFASGRLVKWLKHFENMLVSNNEGKIYQYELSSQKIVYNGASGL